VSDRKIAAALPRQPPPRADYAARWSCARCRRACHSDSEKLADFEPRKIRHYLDRLHHGYFERGKAPRRHWVIFSRVVVPATGVDLGAGFAVAEDVVNDISRQF